mgnify:CR=1 FL=1
MNLQIRHVLIHQLFQVLLLLYIYLNIFSKDKKELEYNLDKIEGILQSKGLQTRRANFRQEQIFSSCLPLLENNEDLKVMAKRNVLTSGLVSTYPFIYLPLYATSLALSIVLNCSNNIKESYFKK